MKKTIMIIAAVLFLTGCGNNEKEQANQLIEAARTHFEQGALDAARADIDSLRKQFPNVVEARKAALQLHQEIERPAEASGPAQEGPEGHAGRTDAADDNTNQARLHTHPIRNAGCENTLHPAEAKRIINKVKCKNLR